MSLETEAFVPGTKVNSATASNPLASATNTIPSTTPSSVILAKEPLLITDFSSLTANNLNGGWTSDDSTMLLYFLNQDEAGATMSWKTDAYWFTTLGQPRCYQNVPKYLYIRVVALGFRAAAGSLKMKIQAATSENGCASTDIHRFASITRWFWDPVAGKDVGEIPLSSFTNSPGDLNYVNTIGKYVRNDTYLSLHIRFCI